MEGYTGRIWLGLLALTLFILVFVFGDSLKPVTTNENPFQSALAQLGILYIVALFVERSLEVIIKAWRQGGKVARKDAERSAAANEGSEEHESAKLELQNYRVGTQKRALLLGLTMGGLVSLAGVRLLGAIFNIDSLSESTFQLQMFNLTDIVLTAGLIAGGSATIHELMALIDEFFRSSRKGVKGH